MSEVFRHFLTALGLREANAKPSRAAAPAHRIIPTDRSTTVFSGEANEWTGYLEHPWTGRRDGRFEMHVAIDGKRRRMEFEPLNEHSVPWAGALTRSFRDLQIRFEKLPAAGRTLNEMIFDNPSNAASGMNLNSSAGLPAYATREMRVNNDLSPAETRILVRTALFEEFEPPPEKDNPLERLGKIWEVLRHILLQLGHESYPRDRFTERIELTTKWAMVNLHALYDGKKDGRPDANDAGEIFEKISARRERMERRELFGRDPFFRLLSDLSFLLRERGAEGLWDTAAIIVRDYLDSRYLRLSIAGLMPSKPEWLEAMPVEWKSERRMIKPPPPEIGRYGIIDDEDEDAWKKVRGPLQDIGYLIIGQLGMGQFGRVYEAINVGNGSIPERVAVKVDRIRKGHKKEAIEAADTIMDIAGGLSGSPHVIRVFDAGYMKKIRSNYHILQIVEGDTLDHLIGIAGTEHASILRPTVGRSSPDEANREFLKSLSGSSGEAWRRNRKSPRFISPPRLGQIMDILTSKALWIEEVHHLGFAINDLKNGNVMMSRRGQFKAIDLDSYSRIFSRLDKLPDFFFLAVSALQLVTRGCAWEKAATSSEIKELLSDPGTVERRLREIWPYGDLAVQSGGRVNTGDVTGFFAHFIDDARSGRFAEDPGQFTNAIDRLIYLKRGLSTEEMVLQ